MKQVVTAPFGYFHIRPGAKRNTIEKIPIVSFVVQEIPYNEDAFYAEAVAFLNDGTWARPDVLLPNGEVITFEDDLFPNVSRYLASDYVKKRYAEDFEYYKEQEAANSRVYTTANLSDDAIQEKLENFINGKLTTNGA